MDQNVQINHQLKWSKENHSLKINQSGKVIYLTYPSLNYDFITHAFSTRLGGVSDGCFSSMNLSFTRGDEETAVRENFRRIAEAIQVSCDDFVFSDQTHTTNIRMVTEEDRGNGITHPKTFYETDGMITNVPGLVLATFYADCVPLFFVDPVHKAIGLSHSGWRGTVGKIGEKTIQCMKEHYETNAEDVIAVIGPSICRDCYEVSEDVAEEFRNVFTEKEYLKFLFPHENDPCKVGKYQLDLWKANEEILLQAGIQEEHLTTPDLCTCCNPNFLFSHRASKGKRGNLGAFLSIKKQ